jgi:2-polyprenyl-3-methyl-5-hydroxy-6-metoxy-1,4-benzoquinol methylase
MSEYGSSFWDERYSIESYVYGTEPNHFFKAEIGKIITPGRLLLPGEGEGRNAVYAAKNGWQVDAFDQSVIARQKALTLAESNDVKINYELTDLNDIKLQTDFYDAVAVIFVHLHENIRSDFNKKLIDSLKVDGLIIMELFSKDQFGKVSGGPQALEMLYSTEELRKDFKDIQMILLREEVVNLDESEKHSGEASVIRFVGKKIK